MNAMDRETNTRKNSAGRLLSEEEAIERLGLSDRRNPPGSLRWLMRVGKLTFVRLGKGLVRFSEEDLAACIQRCRVSHEK